MARLAGPSASADLSQSTSNQHLPSGVLPTPASPESPAASGSDKENDGNNQSGKRKSLTMAEPSQVGSTQKKRRLGGGHMNSVMDKKYYDPDQDPEQRRRTKKGMRDLYSKLNDSKSEYVQSESRGLIDTLTQANHFYKSVKQTSDATVDSRILVATADLSLKRVKNATLGDSSVNVDVDDFVSKCISFMKRGDMDAEQPTQRRQHQNDDDDQEDNGDTMNWKYLGSRACFLYNSRPCLSGFLLGPLSVQKKTRQQTQRRNESRQAPAQLLRPIELTDEDLEKQESANLSQVCKEIASLLERTCREREARLEKEYNEAEEDWSEDQMHAKMREYGLADDGGIPLFEFCVNPKSFGQTVENMFYVSFLIKESTAGLGFDSDGLPTLQPSEQKSLAERQQTQRNQAVFTLSFDVWEQIVESFGIEKSIIPHREDTEYEDGVLVADDDEDPQLPSRDNVETNNGTQAEESAEDSEMYG